MQKETSKQMTSKIQEVKEMTSQNIPYSNKALLKWSALKVVRSDDKQRPYKLVKTALTELVKSAGYEQFRDRFNWLYKNYSPENYQLVWSELQNFNARRIQKCFQDNAIEIADAKMQKTIDNVVAHFGEIPAWIEELSENQRALLLDRAKTCYGLYPEYELCTVETKQLYAVPERYIKDFDEFGNPVYYSNEELYKAHVVPSQYQTLVGRVQVTVEMLRRVAENAVIRDARWLAQFNNTELDMRELREVEDTDEHNKMVPIADLQGPDTPYGLDIEFRDFLEPIYEDDNDELSEEDSILDTIIAKETADGEGL